MINLGVADRPAVVVGGGTIAARKVHDLLLGRARVTVIAPVICGEIDEMAARERVRIHRRGYETGDLAGAFVAVAATDDEALNARIFGDAQSLGILINVVDRPPLCTFTLPAVVRRGDLTIAISTDGRCPALASVMREDLERQFGVEYAEVVTVLAAVRRELMERGWTGDRIRAAVREIYDGRIAETIARADRDALDSLRRKVLEGG